MIVTRSPLRITLGGGGTDLPQTEGPSVPGYCLAAAISQYVYVSVIRPFTPGIYLKYSQLEHVERIDDVQHALIRETLHTLAIPPQVEITTLADVPAGTGLGSSSSFLVALLLALQTFKREHASAEWLAQTAREIEQRVESTVGFQDQYAAAYGGVSEISEIEGKVVRSAVAVPAHVERRLLLFYTGVQRSAATVLARQRLSAGHRHALRSQAWQTHRHLQDHGQIGIDLNEQWMLKERRCPSDPEVKRLRNRALWEASGVKLIGAGEGGFLLCFTDNPEALRRRMSGYAEELPFHFDYEGAKVITV